MSYLHGVVSRVIYQQKTKTISAAIMKCAKIILFWDLWRSDAVILEDAHLKVGPQKAIKGSMASKEPPTLHSKTESSNFIPYITINIYWEINKQNKACKWGLFKKGKNVGHIQFMLVHLKSLLFGCS